MSSDEDGGDAERADVPPPAQGAYVPPPAHGAYGMPPAHGAYVPPPAQGADVPPPAHGAYGMPPAQGVYGIGVTSDLVGMGVQNLRAYERAGLLMPSRTPGGTRLYSPEDVARLRRIQSLLAQGLNLAGIGRVLDLEDDNQRLRDRLDGQGTHDSNATAEGVDRTAQ